MAEEGVSSFEYVGQFCGLCREISCQLVILIRLPAGLEPCVAGGMGVL